MEELKKAEISMFTKGAQPDYSRNEFVSTNHELQNPDSLLFLKIEENSTIHNGKIKHFLKKNFWKSSMMSR